MYLHNIRLCAGPFQLTASVSVSFRRSSINTFPSSALQHVLNVQRKLVLFSYYEKFVSTDWSFVRGKVRGGGRSETLTLVRVGEEVPDEPGGRPRSGTRKWNITIDPDKSYIRSRNNLNVN